MLSRPALEVTGLIGSKPLEGVSGHKGIPNSMSFVVPLVDSPQLVLGFEPGMGFILITDLSARSVFSGQPSVSAEVQTWCGFRLDLHNLLLLRNSPGGPSNQLPPHDLK